MSASIRRLHLERADVALRVSWFAVLTTSAAAGSARSTRAWDTPGLFVTPNLDDLISLAGGTDEKSQTARAELQTLRPTPIGRERLRYGRSIDYPAQLGSAVEVNIAVFRMYREPAPPADYLFDERNNSSIAGNCHDSAQLGTGRKDFGNIQCPIGTELCSERPAFKNGTLDKDIG